MHVLGKRVPQDARKYCDLIQELGADAGCQFLKLGPSSTILRHQAEEGFAHVEEQTLEEIHENALKIPKLVADEGACRKSWTTSQSTRRLRQRTAAASIATCVCRPFSQPGSCNPDGRGSPN